MLQDYEDIIEMVRRLHTAHPPSCPTMKGSEPKCLCPSSSMPTWHDENGVPRFVVHHPKHAADIYATEVALLQIGCQACAEEFSVQMSWSVSDTLLSRAKAFALVERLTGAKLSVPHFDADLHSLATSVRGGIIHYGDPPHHDCAAGVTMNCWDLKVLEFWSRDNAARDWQRVAELEIDLPDLADPERNHP